MLSSSPIKVTLLCSVFILSTMTVGFSLSPSGSPCLAFAGSEEPIESMTTKKMQNSLASDISYISRHVPHGKINDNKIILRKKMKKAVFSQNGSPLYLKTNPDDSTKNLAKKVLMKKDVRRSEKKPHIQKNQEMEGRDGDSKMIAAIYRLFKKTNKKGDKDAEPADMNTICGLSFNGIPHVILKNGNKVFKGGKLDDGCIVDSINNDTVMLDCNGFKRKLQY